MSYEELEKAGQTSWHWWCKLRTLCQESGKLGVLLELTADIPPDFVIERWLSEPIRAVEIPTSLFMTNKNGFPVLSRAHQKIVNKLFNLDLDFFISGNCKHADKGLNKYYEYMNYLFKVRDNNWIWIRIRIHI